MCKAAYFILVPILIYSFNPTLKTKNWGCYTSFQKWVFQSQISQKGAHACQFWLVPAGDEMWTSQYIEKILHCVLVRTHPKNPHPHCICLGKGQVFRTQSRILKYLYSFQIQCWPCTNSAFKTGQLKDIFKFYPLTFKTTRYLWVYAVFTAVMLLLLAETFHVSPTCKQIFS